MNWPSLAAGPAAGRLPPRGGQQGPVLQAVMQQQPHVHQVGTQLRLDPLGLPAVKHGLSLRPAGQQQPYPGGKLAVSRQ